MYVCMCVCVCVCLFELYVSVCASVCVYIVLDVGFFSDADTWLSY